METKIYNIPASCSFLDVIAEHFLEEYKLQPFALADVLFLLPNRRACKSLQEAFVRQQGLQPTILPQMQPLAETEEEALQITGFDLSEELKNLSPAMSATERLMIFTKIIMSKPADYGLEKMPAGQAVALASELCSLMDLTTQQQLSFDKLDNIVPEEYAVHWQETLKFLRIITQYWPGILQDSGKIDAVERQQLLLQVQINVWKKINPQKRIVVAGTTAAFPLMKELVKTVYGLDNGQIFLAGLDKYLDEESWQQIDEVHPQYELKQLLDYLDIDRFLIPDFVLPQNKEREILVSEVMRPARTSEKWRQLDKSCISDQAISGMHFINCNNARIEALVIALLMRETLNTPEKTAALVTTDRTLARQVAAALARWNIQVDDSAGVPLTLTPVGIFLRQILSVIEEHFSPTALLSLMKYPLFANGEKLFDVRRKVRLYECQYLREKNKSAETDVVDRLKKVLEELSALYEKPKVSVLSLLQKHIQAAELLATTDVKSGDKVLWKGDDGEAAAKFIADVLDKAGILGEISPMEYAGWFDVLMGRVTVRRRYGMHPRLKILGPIEARLMQFDRIIIGEVNEGSWPQAVQADPWLSRPMKKDFGLPLPEKNIGVLAQDFSSLLCGQEVFITRADRVQRTPMVKSRWSMRIETVLQALGVNPKTLESAYYTDWAEYMDKASVLKRILPPAPKPPVSARPRCLSASAVENLMRDPYIIYAKYILKLKPLDGLEQALTFADYGSIVHEILEEFNNKYSDSYPQNAKEELLRLGDIYFEKYQIPAEQIAFWRPNFIKIIDWLVARETTYRQNIAKIYNEVEGSYNFEAPAGDFIITAKADRVDVTRDGKINILDYKTGQARSPKEIKHSYAPQLPIEAIIAEKGAFPGIEKGQVESLRYWQLGRQETGIFADVEEVLQNTYDRIVELVSLFDFETTGYISKPNPKYAPRYSDYEHLSRMAEITFGEDD